MSTEAHTIGTVQHRGDGGEPVFGPPKLPLGLEWPDTLRAGQLNGFERRSMSD